VGIIHCDAFDQGSPKLPSGTPVRLIKALGDWGSQIFQSSHDQPEFGLQGRLIGQLVRLGFEVRTSLVQAGNARRTVALLK
jgi:hypothetical protein